MTHYYARRLSGRRLAQCYELASPRVQRYLEGEIQHVLNRLPGQGRVLELGCGYGRVALRLTDRARRVVGIDTAEESLALARETAGRASGCAFVKMDAVRLGFRPAVFDAVVCVQNGICAFGADPERLIQESLRCTRTGGILLFSTYADRFWEHRLEWFLAQAAAGLIGPVDRARSKEGTIVCTDGFRASRLTPEEWRRLCRQTGVSCRLEEVDGSSLFCEMVREGPRL